MKRLASELVAEQLQKLEALDAQELRAEWRERFRCPAPKWMQRDLLLRVIAYHLQEQSLGGLKASTRRKLRQLAETEEPRKPSAPKLKPGSQLLREWNGEMHRVDVLEAGFLWRGRTYPSLSVIAREITGSRWSGPRFFGLIKAGAASPARRP
jgi:hypothetical protein